MALAGGKEYIHTSSGLNTEERKCAGWKISCGLVTRLKTNFVMIVNGCVLSEGKKHKCKTAKAVQCPWAQASTLEGGEKTKETEFNRRRKKRDSIQ